MQVRMLAGRGPLGAALLVSMLVACTHAPGIDPIVPVPAFQASPAEAALQAAEERRELALRIYHHFPIPEAELAAREEAVREIVRSLWLLREHEARQAQECEKAEEALREIYACACADTGYDLAGPRFRKRVRELDEAAGMALARIPAIAGDNAERAQALRKELERAYAEANRDLELMRGTIEVMKLPPDVCREVAPKRN